MPSPSGALARLAVDPRSAVPLHRQIYQRMRAAVLEGALAAGMRLPSTRVLAAELGLSRTTVLAAYDQLAAEGYIEARVGAGSRVAAVLPEELSSVGRPAGRPRPRLDGGARLPSARGRAMAGTRFGPELRVAQPGWRAPFRIGVPALDAFPHRLWSRLVARHLRRASLAMVDYQDPQGLKPLREAIAAHLSLSRGLRCTAAQVLVTAGAQSAIDLATRLLLDPGELAIVEDPSHLGFHGALKGAGVGIVGVGVDREGLRLDPASTPAGARLACVTPSHQFPLAVTMSLPRRLALLEWARRRDAWILEDDYDSEFRFAGRPLEALAALDRDGRVLYLGSFSKIMFPGLRLGYLVVAEDLVETFVAARRFVDVHPPALAQAALADFFEAGHFGRHLRRMRMLYRERGLAMKAAVDRELGGALELETPAAGLHAVAWMPKDMDDAALSRAAAAEGIEARPLSLYATAPAAPALVLGFGSVAPRGAREGARALARAFEKIRREARKN
jgi:GntR family transcriptional regulator/MocR family aminotransferase